MCHSEMIASEYNDLVLFVSYFDVGVDAAVYDKDDEKLHFGAVRAIALSSEENYDEKSEEILNGGYDATGEFITDDICAYVGINYIKE